MRRSLIALVLVLALAPTAPVRASLSEEYTYTYDQMWRAAVRMVAVDFRFPITDRDPDIGYVLFDYRDQGRSYAGSLELVRTHAPDGTDRVRAVVQVNAMPSYVSRMMLDHFTRKLRDDYGAQPVRRAPPPPPPDAGVAEEPSDGEHDGEQGTNAS